MDQILKQYGFDGDYWPDVQTLTSSNEHDDHTKEVIKKIIFSKNFVPTYYLVLLAVVIVATIVHWRQGRARTRSKTRIAESPSPSPSTASSSSSTLLGSESPLSKKTLSERHPLLLDKISHAQPNGVSWRLRSRVASLLLYQPRPRPALTAPSNRLPSNATSLAILFLIAINVFYLFYRNPPVWSNLIVFADRAGFCFVANLPVIYLLVAKDNKHLISWTGWSHEGLNIFHRRLGEWMVFLAIVHMAGMVGLWYTVFRVLKFTFLRFLALRIIYMGFLAFSCYILLWVTSFGYVRRKSYELFLASHVFFQLAGLVFLFFHHHNTRPYIGAALGKWVFDRLSARTLLLTQRFVATLEVASDGNTVLLYIDVPISHKRFRHRISNGWRAGQHVFITIPSIGSLHRYQMHPFTIASPAPPSSVESGTWPLQLTIRAHGGFSSELLEYARLHQHTHVYIDGPYGSVEPLEALSAADRTMLIAGGSGIAVSYPLSWSVQLDRFDAGYIRRRPVYENGRKTTPKITMCPPPFEPAKHCHLWVRQDPQHDQWVTLVPQYPVEATRVDRPDSEQQSVELINKVFNTRSDSAGRPDISLEIEEWVRAGSKPLEQTPQRICVVVCGPDQLARQVRNCVAKLVEEGLDIDLYVEPFEW